MTFTNNDWWRDAVIYQITPAHSAMPMETATVISKA